MRKRSRCRRITKRNDFQEFLYHGTSERHLQKILKEGIKPRGENPSNWEIESLKNAVYLTTVYSGYYAATTSGVFDERWCVIEINLKHLEKRKLIPDEDYIADRQCYKDKLKDRNKVTQSIRENILNFQSKWKESIGNLGTCAYLDTVPISAINRISLFDPNSNRDIAIMWLDPVISINAFPYYASKYHALTKWLLGEKISAQALFPGFVPPPHCIEETEQELANQVVEIIPISELQIPSPS